MTLTNFFNVTGRAKPKTKRKKIQTLKCDRTHHDGKSSFVSLQDKAGQNEAVYNMTTHQDENDI